MLFQKGHTTWNKGLKGYRTGERPEMKGRWVMDKNPRWSGEKVTYSGVHQWIRKLLGTASRCVHCGITKAPRGKGIKRSYFQWANISLEYRREISDWLSLCYKCHKAFDKQ